MLHFVSLKMYYLFQISSIYRKCNLFFLLTANCSLGKMCFLTINHWASNCFQTKSRGSAVSPQETTKHVLCPGQAYVQSGASEMEALHEAYRQIHVVEDSDDHYSSLKGRGGINRPESLSSPPQHARQSLQPASTNESGQTPPCCKLFCGLPLSV